MARTSTDSAGTHAVNNPVTRAHAGRELHSDDLPIRDIPSIDLDDHDGDVIVASTDMLNSSYANELAFMEEYIEIYLNRGRERHAPLFEQVGVNGQILWIIVEKPVRIKRKFVEVLARSMPMDISTQSGETDGDAITYNKAERSQSANFSFSVLRDDNPKGAEWLARVRREN